MKVFYESTVTGKTAEFESDVAEFYSAVAQKIAADEHGRGTVKAETEDGCVVYSVGIRSGTQVINEVSNTLPDSYNHGYRECYLTCIDPGKNAYKFYHMTPTGRTFLASYGRMGTIKGQAFGERSFEYPLSVFWAKYFEKIGKGYVDDSDVYIRADHAADPKPATSEKKAAFQPKKQTASSKLFDFLMKLAKHAVREAKVQVPITPEIIEAAKKYLDQMRTSSTTEEFNTTLLRLMAILQRPVPTGDGMGVRNALSKSSSDFGRIIEREEDLVAAMEGTLGGTKPQPSGDFSDFGIEVYEATKKQKKDALKSLSPSLVGKVKNVYRVIPQEQSRRFNAYLKKNDIKTVKQLWHGSRNENWMSIIRNSLVLNPNAIITGKMFGHGIYFAPSSMKSWGYTSNGKWTGTSSRTSIMGLYAVAYGKPYDVSHWRAAADWKGEMLSHGCNCVHAHEGADLRADEIIVYDEAAIVLNYIVEFAS